MSKQDYELIAGVFAGVNPDDYTSPDQLRTALLHQLALALRRNKTSFNVVQFMKAARPTRSAVHAVR
jgi:hypothetical protein